LPNVLNPNTYLFFEHDPGYATGTVKLGDRGYSLDKGLTTQEFNSL
jgi:hypothetical protein